MIHAAVYYFNPHSNHWNRPIEKYTEQDNRLKSVTFYGTKQLQFVMCDQILNKMKLKPKKLKYLSQKNLNYLTYTIWVPK